MTTPQASKPRLATLLFALVITFTCGAIIYSIRPKPAACIRDYLRMELEDETHFPLPPLEPITTHNVRQIQRLATLRTGLTAPVDIEFSPNSQMLVMTSGSDPYLVVNDTYWWMLNNYNLCIQGYGGGYGSYQFRGFSPDSSLMLIQTNQGPNTIRLLDIEYRHFFAEYYRAAFVVADGEVRLRYQANRDSPVELHPIRWSIPEDINSLRAILDTPKLRRIIIDGRGNIIDKSNPLLLAALHVYGQNPRLDDAAISPDARLVAFSTSYRTGIAGSGKFELWGIPSEP